MVVRISSLRTKFYELTVTIHMKPFYLSIFITWNLWNLLNFNCGFLWKFKKMQLTISGLRIGVVSPEDEGEFKRDVCSLSWFTADTKTWKKNVQTKCYSNNYSSIFLTPGKGKLFHIWRSFKIFRVRLQILTEKKK